MDRLQLLKNLPLFEGLGEDALNRVAERLIEKHLPRDAQLFREGQPCQGLYIVAQGRVVVYQASADGREYVLENVKGGHSLAELPLFDGGPYPASARAAEDSVVAFLSLADFQSLYRNSPEIADVVIRHLGGRMRRLVRLVERLSLKDVPARLAATLLDYGRAAGALRSGAVFTLPRTHYELAAELGTSRETVTRAFMRLRRQGVIDGAGSRIRIVDVNGLYAAAMMNAPATRGSQADAPPSPRPADSTRG